MKMKKKNKMVGRRERGGINAAVRISFLLRGLRLLISFWWHLHRSWTQGGCCSRFKNGIRSASGLAHVCVLVTADWEVRGVSGEVRWKGNPIAPADTTSERQEEQLILLDIKCCRWHNQSELFMRKHGHWVRLCRRLCASLSDLAADKRLSLTLLK